ncbi:putative TIR domain-containing protein [Helianthus annuus]|nr:putative TIR domain-containing protein [Helianthus annuus]
MAFISSSTSSPIHYTYDVFLSFRGEDTRNSFTNHLYEALHQAGFNTFRDDVEIQYGPDLKLEFERSIRKSRASIIVFSKNFANSSWFLDELCLILKLRREDSHFVLPVFYSVDPSDIKNQRGSFAIKAIKGAEGSRWAEDNMNRWKAALIEVANMAGAVYSGAVYSGYDATFVAHIVHIIHGALDSKSSSFDSVGDDELLNTLKLALQCVHPLPQDQPNAQLVLQRLEEIRPETITNFVDGGGVGP